MGYLSLIVVVSLTLLEVLDAVHIPHSLQRLARNAPVARRTSALTTVPRYMLRLYEQRTQSHADACSLPMVYNLGNLGNQESCTTLQLKFNISSIEAMHQVAAARLHLEMDPSAAAQVEESVGSRKLRLRLFQPNNLISNAAHVENPIKDGNIKGQLIHSKTFMPKAARDLALDITAITKSIRAINHHWLELLLVVESMPPSCEWVNHFVSMLEVEIEGPSCITPNGAPQRKRRSADKVQSAMCRRKDLHVNFEEIGWGEWVVAPDGYDAYMCEGKCPFPVNDNLNATNHAILQNLLHFHRPKHVPPACCVPTSLSPISMLYYDSNDNLVLRVYDDMSVDSCGCQ